MVDILAAILNFLKSSTMPAHYHLDYLTLKHLPTTKLSIKKLNTKHQLQKYRSFSEKTHFGGHIGGHFMILYDVSLSLLKTNIQQHIL